MDSKEQNLEKIETIKRVLETIKMPSVDLKYYVDIEAEYQVLLRRLSEHRVANKE